MIVQKTFEDLEPTFSRHSVELLQTALQIIRAHPFEFDHGLTPTELEEKHKILVQHGKFQHRFKTYENRVRDNFGKYKTFGKHYVHGYIHYFPISLHEKGLINHSRCERCQLP